MNIDTSLLLAILAAIVSIMGWVTNYILSGRDERRKKQLDASLAYIESQLQDLYGPLTFLIQESRRTHQDLLQALGRDHVFEEGKELSEADLKTWLFWVENDILPRNEQIKQLITGKTHLIHGNGVPQSYMDFLEHYNSWKINHLRWQKEQVKYSWRSSRAFPTEFETRVLDVFDHLKDKHARMIGERHVQESSLQPSPPTNPLDKGANTQTSQETIEPTKQNGAS